MDGWMAATGSLDIVRSRSVAFMVCSTWVVVVAWYLLCNHNTLELVETQLCGELTASEKVVHQLREDAQMQHEELQELRAVITGGAERVEEKMRISISCALLSTMDGPPWPTLHCIPLYSPNESATIRSVQARLIRAPSSLNNGPPLLSPPSTYIINQYILILMYIIITIGL